MKNICLNGLKRHEEIAGKISIFSGMDKRRRRAMFIDAGQKRIVKRRRRDMKSAARKRIGVVSRQKCSFVAVLHGVRQHATPMAFRIVVPVRGYKHFTPTAFRVVARARGDKQSISGAFDKRRRRGMFIDAGQSE